MTTRKLPPTASVATQGEGGKLVAPAAERNCQALCDVLSQWAPSIGSALEIASGTGQHVAAFARRFPVLQWQPSEIDGARRNSIDAYTRDLPNVRTAMHLDATTAGWGRGIGQQDLIILINLLHLISWSETKTLIAEAAQALAPLGRMAIYGPFKRSGVLTSEGDEKFHDALVRQDADIGYKNDQDILDLWRAAGISTLRTEDMPANNLAILIEK